MVTARSQLFSYLSSFFIIIAAVLGTGILALPVKLVQSGFAPFIFSFALCYCMEAMILVYIVILLQIARAVMEEELVVARLAAGGVSAHELTNRGETASHDETGDGRTTHDERDQGEIAMDEAALKAGPDLHLLGRLFLGPVARIVFDACVMLHFVSILISYTLAGSQAYGDVLGIEESNALIPPFVLVFTGLVIFFSGALHHIISLVTLTKGVVLIAIIGVTGVVSRAAHIEYQSDWVFVGHPLLIGTVALGGGGNVLPVILAKVSNTTREIRRNTIALVSGLFAVFVLSGLWSYFILRSVPQHVPEGIDRDDCTTSNILSLGQAQSCGKIATIPLIQVVHTTQPRFNWIATFVDVFITLSISISFVTMSMGTKHVLDGFATAWSRSHSALARKTDLGARCGFGGRFEWWRRMALYVATWVPVLLMAMSNPKSFLIMMEKVTSLVLNLEAGVFICMMIGKARHDYAHVKIAFPLQPWMFKAHYFVMAYFMFAVVFDVLQTIDEVFLE